MNGIVFISLIFGIQFFCWFICRRKKEGAESERSYFLAEKKVKVYPLLMTFLATQLGGGFFLGAAQEAYTYGWAVLFYPLGAALGLVLLGSVVGKKLAAFPVTTVAQVLEYSYKSKRLKQVASLFSIVCLFLILVAQISASWTFCLFAGLSNPLLFFGFWALVILYTVRGGLKGVIKTDAVQALFFILALVFCLLWTVLSSKNPEIASSTTHPYLACKGKLTGWFLMPLLFMFIEQDMAQRCFAANSTKTVSRAATGAGVILFCVSMIPIFFGILARKQGVVINAQESVLMKSISVFTNPWVTAIGAVAILAATISTATSLINAVSSNIASDFQVPKPKRIALVISLAAIGLGYFADGIVDILITSYTLSVGCLLIPTVLALVKREGNKRAAFTSIGFGIAGFIAFWGKGFFIPSEVCILGCSGLGYFLGTCVKSKKDFISKI